MIRRNLLTAAFAALAWPGMVEAHALLVFAAVEGETVVVEAKFSNGRPVREGVVRVLDADGAELRRIVIEPGTAISFPLDPEAASGGLVIEVDAGEGHDNYWILTPEDIASAQAGETR
ncbi:hypothetical protein BH23PSE1_BH23PSE1_03520 [soil metagenome]